MIPELGRMPGGEEEDLHQGRQGSQAPKPLPGAEQQQPLLGGEQLPTAFLCMLPLPAGAGHLPLATPPRGQRDQHGVWCTEEGAPTGWVREAGDACWAPKPWGRLGCRPLRPSGRAKAPAPGEGEEGSAAWAGAAEEEEAQSRQHAGPGGVEAEGQQ